MSFGHAKAQLGEMFGNAPPVKGLGKTAKSGEEEAVLEAGKSLVADLESNRLSAAYKSTTADYQKQTDRKTFDEMIRTVPGVRHLSTVSSFREQKARKAPDGKSWEFYFTGQDMNQSAGKNTVNVAATFVQEADAWRVQELEITADK